MKIVITGPSSSGKSEIIKALKTKRYSVLEEVAQDVLKKFRGREENPDNINLRQMIMCSVQYYRELEYDHSSQDKPNEVLFLDRGLYDYIGYSFYLTGGGFSFPKEKRYDKVFALAPNNFEKINKLLVRIEKDVQESMLIFNNWVRYCYEASGHEIIEVPNFCDDKSENIEKRIRYIMEKSYIK